MFVRIDTLIGYSQLEVNAAPEEVADFVFSYLAGSDIDLGGGCDAMVSYAVKNGDFWVPAGTVPYSPPVPPVQYVDYVHTAFVPKPRNVAKYGKNAPPDGYIHRWSEVVVEPSDEEEWDQFELDQQYEQEAAYDAYLAHMGRRFHNDKREGV